jgi:hypothetical protein
MSKRKKKQAAPKEAVWLQMDRDDVPEGKTPYEMRNRRHGELTGDRHMGDGAWPEGTIFRSREWVRQKLTERETNVIKRAKAR